MAKFAICACVITLDSVQVGDVEVKGSRGELYQEMRKRIEGQRVRPSSKASLEAAASSTPSDGSHPPLGT